MLWVALQALPERASAELVDGCSALGWWALQFTPKVARVDDVLLLELSASERLWGGRSALLRHIHAADKPVAGVSCARGSTSLIALAQLRLLQSPSLPNRARSRTVADDLPLTTLAAAQPHLATLERLGCTRWGQLRALPRGGVVRRFGADLLDALDRAYGQAPDSYPWLLLPEQFDATLELGAQVEAAPALLFAARRLFNQLQLWLQARHAGVLALLLGWTMDERRNTASHGELVLRTAEPSADMAHLQRLLAEQLARITLPAPVLYLHLRSLETEKLRGETGSLLPQEQVDGDSLLQMQERLCARLGAGQVLQVQALAEHRPERMQLWQTLAEDTRQGKFAQSDQSALYPSWLLARPLRLAVRDQCPQYPGPLTLLVGPQRLEAAWWGGADCALRDYFLARSEQFGLLWIYRERLSVAVGTADADASWYLHGLFA
ncbi:MAG: DNA polymerase Y family protein [Comamonadaceae bacterium]